MQCFFPILSVAIAYPMIGLNMDAARLIWFYAIIAVVTNCGAGSPPSKKARRASKTIENRGLFSRFSMFFRVFCHVFLSRRSAQGMGFAVSAAVPSVTLALSIAPGLVMPQMLLAGIFIKAVFEAFRMVFGPFFHGFSMVFHGF